jgi:hypothetical protein
MGQLSAAELIAIIIPIRRWGIVGSVGRIEWIVRRSPIRKRRKHHE